jgi:DNA repair ATPase RecN
MLFIRKMSGLQGLKQDIDLINNFSAEFYNKTNTVSTKLATSIQKTDTVINEEKKNEQYLSNLEKKVSDIELSKIMETLQNYQSVLDDKQSEYSKLLENNSKKIQNVSGTIRKNKEIIDNIYELMSNIENKVANMEPKK